MTETKILLVDDEQDILEEYKEALEDEPFNVLTETNPEKAIDIIKGDAIPVLVTDFKMPEMTGLDLIKKTAKISPSTIPIILTGNADKDMAINAINSGELYRFLEKPCKPDDFLFHVKGAVEFFKERENVSKSLSVGNEGDSEASALTGSSLPDSLESTNALFTVLVTMIKIKSRMHFHNGQWVANFSKSIAEKLELSDEDTNLIYMSAMIKNFSLLLLPEVIGEKPQDMLTREDRQKRVSATITGASLFKNISGFEKIAEIMGDQNERWNGSGPKRLTESKIPIGAQIISIANDTYTILFIKARHSTQGSIYGKSFVAAHIKKSINKLYGSSVAKAALSALKETTIH